MKKKIRSDLQQILSVLKQELSDLFGDQLEDIYLYGSQARGEAGPWSDIDVLIILREEFDYIDMIQRTSEIIGRLSLENDVVISRAFATDKQFKAKATPWLINIHKEGIAV